MIIGKRRRRPKQKKVENENESKSSLRKKKVVTSCEHVDREYYARGMCKNCYHKKGRTKPAICCPEKAMYSKNLCQNCYMKHYGKEKRKETKIAKIAAKASNHDKSHDKSHEKSYGKSSDRATKKSNLHDMTAPKRQRTGTSAARRNSILSEADPTAPTLNVRPDGIVAPKQIDVLKISKRKSVDGKMQRTPSLKASIMITTTTPPKPLPPPAAKTYYHGTIEPKGEEPSPQRSQR